MNSLAQAFASLSTRRASRNSPVIKTRNSHNNSGISGNNNVHRGQNWAWGDIVHTTSTDTHHHQHQHHNYGPVTQVLLPESSPLQTSPSANHVEDTSSESVPTCNPSSNTSVITKHETQSEDLAVSDSLQKISNGSPHRESNIESSLRMASSEGSSSNLVPTDSPLVTANMPCANNQSSEEPSTKDGSLIDHHDSRNYRVAWLTIDGLQKQFAEYTPDHIESYMSANLFRSKTVIPLWQPSPPLNTELDTWKTYIQIGDIGLFNASGGFDTFFNVFLTLEDNYARGYHPPANFVPYRPNIANGNPLAREYKDLEPRVCGFINELETSDDPQCLAKYRLPPVSRLGKRPACAALNLLHGYAKFELEKLEQFRIKEYMEKHQRDWHRHVFSDTDSANPQGSLVLIIVCYRSKSWAMAAARDFSSKRGKVTMELRNAGNGAGEVNYWKGSDELILTQHGPLTVRFNMIQSHLAELDMLETEKSHKKAIREAIELCNCVAVEAVFAQEERIQNNLPFKGLSSLKRIAKAQTSGSNPSKRTLRQSFRFLSPTMR